MYKNHKRRNVTDHIVRITLLVVARKLTTTSKVIVK